MNALAPKFKILRLVITKSINMNFQVVHLSVVQLSAGADGTVQLSAGADGTVQLSVVQLSVVQLSVVQMVHLWCTWYVCS